MKKLKINLGARSHAVYSGDGIVPALPRLLEALNFPRQLAVVTDRTVARRCLPLALTHLRRYSPELLLITMPAGEQQKTFSRVEKIVGELVRHGFSRSSGLVSFGGGVVGDVTAFTASIFRRGIPYIQVPTTLLGQVESALGGKTGINHPLSKNAAGSFYQPKLILSDTAFLQSLPRREIICGLGEVVKYALLDDALFDFLEGALEKIFAKDPGAIGLLVRKCNVIKKRLIEADECETDHRGGRMVLNLGHTIGHALEVHSEFRLHHGEAVLLGLRWESEIALRAGILEPALFKRLDALLARINFAPELPSVRKATIELALLGGKKKTSPRFVLPRKAGEAAITREIDPQLIRRVLAKYLR
jgi:3-dehydroquinate synthetase